MLTRRMRAALFFALLTQGIGVSAPLFASGGINTAEKGASDLPVADSVAQAEPAQAPSTPTTTARGSQEVLYTPVNAYDTLIDTAKRQMDQVSAILSALSAMIHNNQIPTLAKKNKVSTLKNIRELSATIELLRREKFAEGHADDYMVYLLQQVNRQVMRHLTKALRKDFTGLPSYKPESQKRADPNAMTLKSMQQVSGENEAALKELLRFSDHAGLRWYNHLYRRLDHFVITPCRKHSIVPRSLLTLGITGIGLFLWRAYNERSFNDGVPAFVSGLYGPRPRHAYRPSTDGLTQERQCINEDELGPVGKIEELWHSSSGSMLMAAGIFGISMFEYARRKCCDEWDNSVRPWLAKRLSVIDSKLKGGACLKEARKKLGYMDDDVLFEDLVGLEGVKRDFSVLVNYLEKPESYDRAGLTPSKGILLVGETRTGKTYSVKALFNEIKRMLKRNGRPDRFKFYNFGAAKIKMLGIDYLVGLVKKEAPCILFIDEIDLLELQRRGNQTVLSEFLQCLSGAFTPDDPKNQVIIIAATNKPENIDHALRQYGRFGKEIRFELPSLSERVIFIERKIRKLSLSPKLFEVDRLARETEGMSYEALNILIGDALLHARMVDRPLTQDDLDRTLDHELRHVTGANGKQLPECERRIMAANLAGKALALCKLDMGTKLDKVTTRPVMTRIEEVMIGSDLWKDARYRAKMKPRFEPGGVFTSHDHDTMSVKSRDEKLMQCQFHLAGDVAEELLTGSCGYSCDQSMEKAMPVALTLTCEGLEYDKLPKHAQRERFNKAMDLLSWCKTQVRKLLEAHVDDLKRLADELFEKETLSAAQVSKIIAANELVQPQPEQAAIAG